MTKFKDSIMYKDAVNNSIVTTYTDLEINVRKVMELAEQQGVAINLLTSYMKDELRQVIKIALEQQPSVEKVEPEIREAWEVCIRGGNYRQDGIYWSENSAYLHYAQGKSYFTKPKKIKLIKIEDKWHKFLVREIKGIKT